MRYVSLVCAWALLILSTAGGAGDPSLVLYLPFDEGEGTVVENVLAAAPAGRLTTRWASLKAF